MEKSKRILIILSIVLVVAYIIEVIYLLNRKMTFDRPVFEPITYISNCDKNDEFVVDINTKRHSIYSYLRKQEDLTILYMYCGKVEGGPYKLDDGEYDDKSYLLSYDENKAFLDSGRKAEINYSYEKVNEEPCMISFEINYIHNGNNYTVHILPGNLLSTNDGNIYKILDDKLGQPEENTSTCYYQVKTPYVEELQKNYN